VAGLLGVGLSKGYKRYRPPTRLGVVPIPDRRQYSLRFHRVGAKEGIMAKEMGITPEEMVSRKRTTELPTP